MDTTINRYLLPILSILMAILIPMLIMVINLLFTLHSEVKETTATVKIILPLVTNINDEQRERTNWIHSHDNGRIVHKFGGVSDDRQRDGNR